MKSDVPYLRDILDRIARIERYISVGQEVFFADTLPQDGVIRNFEIIGKAVKRLSVATTGGSPDIPWKDIAGLRDKVIHDYLGVDVKLIWKIAQNDIPKLKKEIENMLANLGNSTRE